MRNLSCELVQIRCFSLAIFKIVSLWDFLVVQWFKTVLSMQKARVQYLVWELRSSDAARSSKKKKQLLSLSLVFRSLVMMCLRVDFFRSV